jgi:hypothetical protein
VYYVLRFTDSDYPFGIFWLLCIMSFALRILTPLVSFGYCVLCPSLYGFWPLWYLLVIVYYVLRFTDSDYPFGIFWLLCIMSFALRILTPLVSFGHCVLCPSLYGFWPLWYLLAIVYYVLRFADSNPFGIFKLFFLRDYHHVFKQYIVC